MSYTDIGKNEAMNEAIHRSASNAIWDIISATGCHPMSAALILSKAALNILAYADQDAVTKIIDNLTGASAAQDVNDPALKIEEEQIHILIAAYERQTAGGEA